MRRQGEGLIINVSSIGGRLAFPFTSADHATKFAVEGMSESMRFELKAHGVRVKIVEPGGVRTNFISRGSEWADYPAYETQLSGFRATAEKLDDTLPGPDVVADVTWRAANDRSDRLRYRAAAGPYWLVNKLLPDAIWRRLVGMALDRRAGRDAPKRIRQSAASRSGSPPSARLRRRPDLSCRSMVVAPRRRAAIRPPRSRDRTLPLQAALHAPSRQGVQAALMQDAKGREFRAVAVMDHAPANLPSRISRSRPACNSARGLDRLSIRSRSGTGSS